MSSRTKISLVPAMVLLVLLLAPQPSSAVPPVSPPPLGPPAETEDPTDLGEEAEGEGTGEGAEEGEEEETEDDPFPPSECVLQSVRAHAVEKRGKLKLTVRYTAYEPVDVTVEIRSSGARVGSVDRRLGRSGVLRITTKLGKKLKAKRLVLSFVISGSPPSCERFRSKTIQIH